MGRALPRDLDTGEAGWRMTWRKTKPEKEPLNVALLQRRLERQMDAKGCRTCRHESDVVKIVRAEKAAVHKRRKELRLKEVVAANLEGAGDSQSSADSNSSDSSAS